MSTEKDLWVAYISSYTSESVYFKIRKISVSAMDDVLVGRRERIHSGVLIGEYVDSCAPPQKSYIAVVVQDSHRVKAGLLQLNSTTPPLC